MWNKQRTDEVLLDVDDVAMGHTGVMRWNARDKWVVSREITHEPLIDDADFEQAQAILQRRGRGTGGQHIRQRTRNPYVFRGLIYCATFAGVVYVAFVVDVYSRAIVGWSAATNKRTPLVLDALDMGLWRRDRDGRTVTRGLIHHSDADRNTRHSGSPPTSSPPASTPPSAPSETPSTTRSWNPRSACTRPN
ncbi:DDE-type integrase/transposase/recombinase [Micromonospora cremea]|uniref:DDE-type integrase/transposase/recombinase n=1 Tax=Micromonospora cremea TaxID=709881 RepID=UPI001FCB8C59|nr:DDE-type integrase/transposase/recombinase [Micromonospora cremea]